MPIPSDAVAIIVITRSPLCPVKSWKVFARHAMHMMPLGLYWPELHGAQSLVEVVEDASNPALCSLPSDLNLKSTVVPDDSFSAGSDAPE
jgi:hypothetical protein